jgi:acetolactate synthase small subunit
MWRRLRDMPPLGLVEVARTGIAAIARGPEGM